LVVKYRCLKRGIGRVRNFESASVEMPSPRYWQEVLCVLSQTRFVYYIDSDPRKVAWSPSLRLLGTLNRTVGGLQPNSSYPPAPRAAWGMHSRGYEYISGSGNHVTPICWRDPAGRTKPLGSVASPLSPFLGADLLALPVISVIGLCRP
jgi:hypothetical protein